MSDEQKNPEQELHDLIQQLSYFDHADQTDVAVQLAGSIHMIRVQGISKDEATELLNDQLKLMKLNSVIERDEVLQVAEALIQKALGVLFTVV